MLPDDQPSSDSAPECKTLLTLDQQPPDASEATMCTYPPAHTTLSSEANQMNPIFLLPKNLDDDSEFGASPVQPRADLIDEAGSLPAHETPTTPLNSVALIPEPVIPSPFPSLGTIFTDVQDVVDANSAHLTQMDHQTGTPTPKASQPILKREDPFDLLNHIPGLFRMLDLYSEEGGDGQVDKIIIAQESLGNFINTLLPHSYRGVTKIDFSRLDDIRIHPLGLYGSKGEIVKLFLSLGAVGQEVANFLTLSNARTQKTPYLRSGIYALVPQGAEEYPSTAERRVYIVYWPEETTWNDDADNSVRKNRAAFMRYLTRLTDQVRCLVSPEHARALIWQDADTNSDTNDEFTLFDVGASDRIFDFKVAKTKDEDENAQTRPGFTVELPPARCAERSSSAVYTWSFVRGEMRQGVLGRKEMLADEQFFPYEGVFNRVRLRAELRQFGKIVLPDDIEQGALEALLGDGELKERAPEYCGAFTQALTQAQTLSRERLREDIKDARLRIKAAIRTSLLVVLNDSYPSLNILTISDLAPEDERTAFISRETAAKYLNDLLLTCPEIEPIFRKTCGEIAKDVAWTARFTRGKDNLLRVHREIRSGRSHSQSDRKEMIDAIFSFNDITAMASPSAERTPSRTYVATAKRWLYDTVTAVTTTIKLGGSGAEMEAGHGNAASAVMDNVDFIAGLRKMVERDPLLLDAVTVLITAACESMRVTMQRRMKDLLPKIEEFYTRTAKAKAAQSLEDECRRTFVTFRNNIAAILSRPVPDRPTLGLQHVIQSAGRLDISGVSSTIGGAHTLFETRTLDISDGDKEQIRQTVNFMPSPTLSRHPVSFGTDITQWSIRSAQYMGRDKILWIVDRPDVIQIWLAKSRAGCPTKSPQRLIHCTEGGRYFFAVDEQQSLLAVVMLDKDQIRLHTFFVDSVLNTIQGRGSPIDLSNWYPEGIPDISTVCFFSGTKELCLVERSGGIRAFSLVTQNFRPGRLDLEQTPMYVQSSPDGSALLVVEPSSVGPPQLRVLHAASFGMARGIVHLLPPEFVGASSYSITSIERQGPCYLLALLPDVNTVQSIAIDISRKETEYSFRADSNLMAPATPQGTRHNALIQCYEEVWDRYPVVPAIERETLSPQGRRNSSLSFICDLEGCSFQTHFKRMARMFIQTSKKPTGQTLERIDLSTSTIMTADWISYISSSFSAGEWLTELFCLIPIHIAVAQENRFLPLKDGVLDPQLEQRLLGAEISEVIDSISLGWYESIFCSYMASKPVKVISSMGEQSVGKSYSLNHIVDASFAGSAVRTTEGVWLSVTPTHDFLIVALDFEGVHSIERTAQEDMLLVLFNTALSNLVVFRNNFAFGRDVAHMFTSFQASTQLLNPAANPKLFKGELAIVIKDVVESDKRGIVQEFSTKFRQIVNQEQSANFISVLHDGRVMIIPWSVIQSAEFYTLFSSLSKRLLREPSTHGSAGEFLLTLKTLMAKLKVQDWGSIDDTVIKHRVATLQVILPQALSYGKSESIPDLEELRNLDNQGLISHDDSDFFFYLEPDHLKNQDPAKRQDALLQLLRIWNEEPARQSLDELRRFLEYSAQRRILHVQEWLRQNTLRFPPDNSDIRSLTRSFDVLRDHLLSNLQVCGASCASCQLPCILMRTDGPHAHDCLTNHRCLSSCDYGEEHREPQDCGMQAGHVGQHICDGTVHLCGQPCGLAGRKGCQIFCSKQSNHVDDGHQCSVRYHQCGSACDLQDVITSLGVRWSCPNPCTLPFDDLHERHSCDDRLSCPIKCELCQRYCALGNHFHGLTDNMHLCGQKHDCANLCQSAGICHVNTVPRSIESQFTGRHATFQYTKYIQEAQRLQCAVEIKPGDRSHEGPHIHTETSDPVHFCDFKCPNCGYFCHFPLNHPQSEHETAHGSMENTNWAIEGDNDATIEVQGRKFGIQEGGAPQICSLVCQELGRHAHLDFCRSEKDGICQEAESEHINTPMLPEVARAKDWISHRLFWARSGFKDPYSQQAQASFALCDAACAGPEHLATATAQPNPSFCTLPIFHPPQPIDWQGGETVHVSNDGHSFACPNPNNLRQPYHVIFVLDRSSSMGKHDIRPLDQQPVTQMIRARNDNRFGAVLSALYGFCVSRGSGAAEPRRDSYSVIAFDRAPRTIISNDFTSSPEELVNQLLNITQGVGTEFDAALAETLSIMEMNWSAERSPIVIFLSDGEGRVSDDAIYDLCDRAIAQGKALSLQTISFGRDRYSSSLRRMAVIAQDVAGRLPPDPISPVIPSAYSDAIDNVHLAQTFLNIADSLKKPRASLMRSTRP